MTFIALKFYFDFKSFHCKIYSKIKFFLNFNHKFYQLHKMSLQPSIVKQSFVKSKLYYLHLVIRFCYHGYYYHLLLSYSAIYPHTHAVEKWPNFLSLHILTLLNVCYSDDVLDIHLIMMIKRNIFANKSKSNVLKVSANNRDTKLYKRNPHTKFCVCSFTVCTLVQEIQKKGKNYSFQS